MPWPSRSCNIPLSAGAVKARSAAERGGGTQRRGLDGAEPSGLIERVMAAAQRIRMRRTNPRLCGSHWKVIVLAQRCLAEIGKNTIQAIQRHCRWRGDLDANRFSVLPIVNDEQTIGRRHRSRALFSRLMREMQVRRKRLAFPVRDLQRTLSHSETSYTVTMTRSKASASGLNDDDPRPIVVARGDHETTPD